MKAYLLRWTCVAATLSLVLAVASSAMAAPIYTRLEDGGVAQVIHTPSQDHGMAIGYNFDTDHIHWGDSGSPGYTPQLFFIDPTVMGDLGDGSVNARTGGVRQYTSSPNVTDFYDGSVTGNTKHTPVGNWSYSGFACVPGVAMFGKGGGGNSAPLAEYNGAISSGGLDVLTDGTTGSPVQSAQLLTVGSLTTGQYHTGLAYLGTVSGNYTFLIVNNTGASNTLRKMTTSATYTLAPGAATLGTRSAVTNTGSNFLSTPDIQGLVPTDTDTAVALATTADLGKLFILTRNGTSTYLSAVEINDVDANSWTQIDLDPGNVNGYKFLNLTGLIRNSADDDNVAGVGLAVNADASRVYVSTADDIFVFTPEPATLGLLAIGFLPLLKRRRK